jgi:hypothetical protein
MPLPAVIHWMPPGSSLEQIGDGFKSSMRVGWKAGDVIVGIIRAKRIEQQEGIEIHQCGLPDNPNQIYSGTIGGCLSGNDLLYLACIHDSS